MKVRTYRHTRPLKIHAREICVGISDQHVRSEAMYGVTNEILSQCKEYLVDWFKFHVDEGAR